MITKSFALDAFDLRIQPECDHLPRSAGVFGGAARCGEQAPACPQRCPEGPWRLAGPGWRVRHRLATPKVPLTWELRQSGLSRFKDAGLAADINADHNPMAPSWTSVNCTGPVTSTRGHWMDCLRCTLKA